MTAPVVTFHTVEPDALALTSYNFMIDGKQVGIVSHCQPGSGRTPLGRRRAANYWQACNDEGIGPKAASRGDAVLLFQRMLQDRSGWWLKR